MGYTIGVSTGLFKIAHSQNPGKSLEFMGLPRKAIWSIYKGVRFAQIDLESISEFLEDKLEEKMKKVKAMGIEFGVHGEVPEYAGRLVPFLDTAEEDVYKRSHDRLIVSAKNCAKIGSKYYLLHSSASRSWYELFAHLGPSQMVDIWGRRFDKLLAEENKDILDWAVEQDFIKEIMSRSYTPVSELTKKVLKESIDKHVMENQDQKITKEQLEKMKKEAEEKAREIFKESLLDAVSSTGIHYGMERLAFFIIAKWMQEGKKCPSELKAIWKGITSSGRIEDTKFRERAENWVPAVTAAYTWGHFNPEECPTKEDRLEDPKPYFDDNKMWMAFETPMAGAGTEETSRLAQPIHIYHMVKNLGTKNAVIVLDFEHQLSSNIDPMKQAEAFPEGEAKWVRLVHVGYPALLAPAHLPIPLGSDAQEYIYKLLWEYRKKGFKDGIIIFERGGGEEPIQETVLALKKVVEFLEKDVPPDKLYEHPDFFGLKHMGPELIRQRTSIKAHLLDPLKGMLSIPEEEYDFLGTSAAAARKLEEWKKEQYK